MSADLALQKSIRTRLVETAALTMLVPASSILDRNQRPAPDPSIIIGEGQTIDEGDSVARKLQRVFMDLHVWKREPGLGGVKLIAATMRFTLAGRRLALGEGYSCADIRISNVRYLRDPDGETSHAVVTVSALVEEIA
ncbi:MULTISPECIES: DUF3168 domain-containing protein [unclassified Rhizobium]|uniref:DUF3168 domain-containing protein n=1 Tax=unclassified Rhizobium TaxID=2613769 RepID=UPI00161B67A0|nr:MULTISPECIES: DUF3168 domain-containing protein [unclassified Rhizobium]MBB3289907.1 hypothetical protein [Rhizobium sp. BK252]MBB3404136.1 hypothetical protein [Rhizobium sp. BK289]MBB3417235.1 hypothetical protein [Rhizobium sp. BK284]MBB3485112.1 hypothetical protein [Rhizobium sp. BK347]